MLSRYIYPDLKFDGNERCFPLDKILPLRFHRCFSIFKIKTKTKFREKDLDLQHPDSGAPDVNFKSLDANSRSVSLHICNLKTWEGSIRGSVERKDRN